MFKEHPQLPRNLDYDHLLKRAEIYDTENYPRKLLEIALEFDLDDYEKQKAMEQVLIFYSKILFYKIRSKREKDLKIFFRF